MAIGKLNQVTFSDFKNLEIVDPDKFDTNYQDCVDKIDEVIDYCNTLDDTTDGNSGADAIGATTISGVVGATVQAILEDLKSQINSVVLGTIPPASIGEDKFSFDVATQAELDALKGIGYSVETLKGAYDLANSLKGGGWTTETLTGVLSTITSHTNDTSKHLSILTTEGDIPYRGSTTSQRLGKGLYLQGLQMNSAETAPQWGNVMIGEKQIITSSTTFTAQKTGIHKVICTAGGGGSGAGQIFGGGGGGGTSIKWVTLNKNDSITVTIGSAGAAGMTNPSSGSTGGTSSFGAHLSATGGSGGVGGNYGGASQGGGGDGGAGSNGHINLKGDRGGDYYNNGSGGQSLFGFGGTSYWGSLSYGCGGGYSANSSDGIVTVEW